MTFLVEKVTFSSVVSLPDNHLPATSDVESFHGLLDATAVKVIDLRIPCSGPDLTSYGLDACCRIADSHAEALGEGGLAVVDSNGIAKDGG